jgi:hypothetical protein
MMMRFRGGGVGHSSTRDATQHFLADRHSTDLSSQHDTYAADEEPSNELAEEVEIEESHDSEDFPSDSSSDDSSGEEDYGYVRYDSDNSDDEEKDPDAKEDEVEQLGFARF